MAYIGNTPLNVAFLTDQFSGNGSTVAFTLSVAPANTASILVAVTGVVQDPSTYSVSGTTLTFSQAPPTGTGNISVRYLGIPASGVTTTAYRTVTDSTATGGQTTFTIPSYTVGYLNVYRNGVRLANADFTATSGTTVVLANAATAGDTITTESFFVSSVLNAIPATSGSVGTTFLADSSVTTAKIAAGAVVQADLATGVAGTGPACLVTRASAQSIPSGSFTKVAFDTKIFDTNNNYNTSNNRFLPTVAGYYQISLQISIAVPSIVGTVAMQLQKNGSNILEQYQTVANVANAYMPTGNKLVFMNGTTDFLEVYGFQNTGSSCNLSSGEQFSFFTAALVRAA